MIDRDMDIESFFALVDAILQSDTTRITGSASSASSASATGNTNKWDYWYDALHASDMYGIPLCECGELLINRAIASSGRTLAGDVELAQLMVLGNRYTRH